MGIFDKIKNMIGFEDAYTYDYDKVETEQKDLDKEETVISSEEIPASPRRSRPSFFKGSMENTSNVIDMPGTGGSQEVVVMYPRKFEEMPAAIQALRERKSIVVNLTTMEPDQAQRCVDFVAGATYAIDGKQERVADSIFFFAPSCVTLTTHNSVTDEEVIPVQTPKPTRVATPSWAAESVGRFG
jgi:cell division inhibitor SepF